MPKLGKAEVKNLHSSIIRNENVLWLQIPMNDPTLVRRRKSVQHLLRVIQGLSHRQRPSLQEFTERPALQQLRNQVRHSLVRPIWKIASMLG